MFRKVVADSVPVVDVRKIKRVKVLEVITNCMQKAKSYSKYSNILWEGVGKTFLSISQ